MSARRRGASAMTNTVAAAESDSRVVHMPGDGAMWVMVIGDLFIFGGLVGETARNDLYQFSTRDLSATLLQACGEIPSPRVGHVSALAGRSTLVMWGGDTKTDPNSKSTDKYDNGLYLLDVGVYLDFSGPL